MLTRLQDYDIHQCMQRRCVVCVLDKRVVGIHVDLDLYVYCAERRANVCNNPAGFTSLVNADSIRLPRQTQS